MDSFKGFFTSEEVRSVLRNRHIVVIGDSVQRGVYKDLVCYLQSNDLMTELHLKRKGELSHEGDRLVYRAPLSNAVRFSEVREFQSEDGYHLVQYYFVTRCYDERVELILQEFEKEPPDVVIMNSCLWDISRYGEDGWTDEYKENMARLLTRLQMVLPKESMFVWASTLPLASEITPQGFLIESVAFLKTQIRLCVVEANYWLAQMVTHYGFDVLDLHFYVLPLISHRNPDGVHWDAPVHRHISDLILAHLIDSWGMPLPASARDKVNGSSSFANAGHLNRERTPSHVEKRAELFKLIYAAQDLAAAAAPLPAAPDLISCAPP